MSDFAALRKHFGDKAQQNAVLAPYTSARIGGPADLLLTISSADELAEAVTICWREAIPFQLFGGGSNLLVSDKGLRGVALLNRAKAVEFREGPEPSLRAESGVVFSNLAKRAAAKGLSGWNGLRLCLARWAARCMAMPARLAAIWPATCCAPKC
jgi:UDP-N-acetylmuramate dehydrogenase